MRQPTDFYGMRVNVFNAQLVVRFESLHTLIAVAVQNGLKLHQIDIITDFLNGKLEEVVFMWQSKGFIAEGPEHLVCRSLRC